MKMTHELRDRRLAGSRMRAIQEGRFPLKHDHSVTGLIAEPTKGVARARA
jgi:hypothetical protein